MMGCDEACAAAFDLVFIGLPLLSLYEIPMLIWFIWRAFRWKRNDKDWPERHGDSCNCGSRSGAPLAVGLVCVD